VDDEDSVTGDDGEAGVAVQGGGLVGAREGEEDEEAVEVQAEVQAGCWKGDLRKVSLRWLVEFTWEG
jgi:hypothetical protein